VPDSPARSAGNPTVRRSSRYQRNRARGRYTPRQSAAPLAPRARQRLAPTWGGWRISGGPSTCLGGAVQPPCVGVRRCLTRRPGGPATRRCADRPGTGETVYVVDTRHGNLPRAGRRGGRGSASPLHGVGGGSAVDPRPASVGGTAPLCRGQAHARGWLWISVFVQPPCVGVRRCLTRRPARAGNPTPMAAAVPLPITVQAVGIERPGLKPRAESASPLKRAGTGAAGAANPPTGERRLDQPASAGLRIEPGRFHPTQSAPAWGPGKAAGRTMMGRRCCPPIRLA